MERLVGFVEEGVLTLVEQADHPSLGDDDAERSCPTSRGAVSWP